MNKHGREMHHYLKLGKMLVSLDLCILNQERNDSWFQERHRQETIALLQDVIAERIRQFYAKKRAARARRDDKEKVLKAEPSKMLQGNTVKIGYKFTKRPVTQRCLFMKAKFEHITLFPETLHVYVCEYHPSTVLQTTAQLLHTMYRETDPNPVGVSNYFQSATNPDTESITKATVSAQKKRNKLKRIVKRQDRAVQAQTEPDSTESGYDTPDGISAKLVSHQDKAGATGGDAQSSQDFQAGFINGQAEGKSSVDSKSDTALGQIIKNHEALRLGGRSKLATGIAGIPEQPKKRKRNRDWAQEEISATSAHTSASVSDGETREPVKRQRASDTNGEAETVRSRGGKLDPRTGKQTLGAVASDVVARANDVEMAAVADEIVDLCAEEVYSDGDVDCLENITQDVEGMSKLSSLHLQRLVSRNKRYLKEIFVGKRPCKRHADYKQGGSTRANLAYEAWYGPYSEEQVDCVMSELVTIYCASHNKYFDYVSKVLLPEALTKICMDVLHTSLEEAQGVLEKTPLCGDATMLGSHYRGGVANHAL
ncbi:uncharacterized protein LOC119742993 [Patiria miniata]|uniref:Uncharacterized protein n=1 Tax=Patiria miniata TaxID=46514 RepID=A0A914BH52_PATMI|nr:uncharacterized protein LOC119742993 [Patiria miniata]